MEIPTKCTVLVIGGGPGGSFCAATLAREGIDVVLLEADDFPRYHIGESMLPSFRHFLRFIGLDQTFANRGFQVKLGSAFRLVPNKKEGYTDFISAGGPDNYTWNVVRSEADHLLFQHAGECGATAIDGIRVDALQFTHADTPCADRHGYSEDRGFTRPVSATYTRKSNGGSGSINFRYVVDASGRAGMINTKCRKDRRYSKTLKNVAHWSYWTGAKAYAVGTDRENSPYFEALDDESGWAWMIPLHDGTVSVGVVQNQEIGNARKRSLPAGSSTRDFYMSSLRLAPKVTDMISSATCETSVKSASDYSYSSASYAIPYARVVGDAGCFIDPFFSSGVHIALTGALSAAMTICAALRRDCDETAAAAWHSTKVGDAYTRFLLVVLSAYRQMWRQDDPVWSETSADNFDEAFDCVQPIIQGVADATPAMISDRVSRALDFCSQAFNGAQPEDKARLLNQNRTVPATAEEAEALKHLQARKLMRIETTMDLDGFGGDVIAGCRPHLHRGELGLRHVRN